jgi:hypothetical protein
MADFLGALDRRINEMSGEDSGGIADAVALIQASAVQNASATDAVSIVKLPETNGAYLITRADGTFQRIVPEPGPPSGALYSVDQVARAAVVFDAALVSITDERVFVHTDRAHLSHGVELPLDKSEAWRVLTELRTGCRALSQAELIRLLRVDLMGTLDANGKRLIEWARTINTTERNESSSTLKSQQESLGRSIDVEVQSAAGEIPEWFVATVPIWSDRSLVAFASVPVLVDYSARNESFVLSPDRREMDEAFETALLDVEVRLRRDVEDSVSAFNAEFAAGAERSVPSVIGAALS